MYSRWNGSESKFLAEYTLLVEIDAGIELLSRFANITINENDFVNRCCRTLVAHPGDLSIVIGINEKESLEEWHGIKGVNLVALACKNATLVICEILSNHEGGINEMGTVLGSKL